MEGAGLVWRMMWWWWWVRPFKIAETVMDTRQIREQGGQVLGLKPKTDCQGSITGAMSHLEMVSSWFMDFSMNLGRPVSSNISHYPLSSQNPPTNHLGHFRIKSHHIPTVHIYHESHYDHVKDLQLTEVTLVKNSELHDQISVLQ